jgi:hypothetical protein
MAFSYLQYELVIYNTSEEEKAFVHANCVFVNEAQLFIFFKRCILECPSASPDHNQSQMRQVDVNFSF